MNRQEIMNVASHYTEKELNIASSVLADMEFITNESHKELLIIIELMKQQNNRR